MIIGVVIAALVTAYNLGRGNQAQVTEEPASEDVAAAPAEAPADPAAEPAPLDATWLETASPADLRREAESGSIYASAAADLLALRREQALQAARGDVGRMTLLIAEWRGDPIAEQAQRELDTLLAGMVAPASFTAWARNTASLRAAPTLESQMVRQIDRGGGFGVYGTVWNERLSWYVFRDGAGRSYYGLASDFSQSATTTSPPPPPPPPPPSRPQPQQGPAASYIDIEDWARRPTRTETEESYPHLERIQRRDVVITLDCLIQADGRLSCSVVRASNFDQDFYDAAMRLSRFYRAPRYQGNRATAGLRTRIRVTFAGSRQR